MARCSQSCVRLSPGAWWVRDCVWERVTVSVAERRYHCCRDAFRFQIPHFKEQYHVDKVFDAAVVALVCTGHGIAMQFLGELLLQACRGQRGCLDTGKAKPVFTCCDAKGFEKNVSNSNIDMEGNE